MVARSQASHIRFAGLNAKSFSDLVADILIERGHSNVVVTDGPGDGQRDVHSVNPVGKKHVVQCKFRESSKRPVGSAELGALGAAMLKFGATEGLLATNGHFSPQALREAIDAFPGMRIEPLDGHMLVEEVLASAELRTVWLEGEVLRLPDGYLTVSYVCRDLATQKPLTLEEQLQNREQMVDSVLVPESDMAPYNPGRRESIFNMRAGHVQVTQVKRSGSFTLRSVAGALQVMRRNVIAVATSKGVPAQLRFGTASWVDSKGTVFARYSLGPSLIVAEGRAVPELAWLLPTFDSGWRLPREVRARNADWAGWAAPSKSCLAFLGAVTPAVGQTRGMQLLINKANARLWKSSVFAEVGRAAGKLASLPPADIVVPIRKGRELWVWLQSGLRSPFRRLSNHEGDDEPDLDNMNTVRAAALRSGLDLVGPEEARGICKDRRQLPFAEGEEVMSSSANLLFQTHETATPIDPATRHGYWAAVWRVARMPSEDEMDQLESSSSGIEVKPAQLDGEDHLIGWFTEHPTTTQSGNAWLRESGAKAQQVFRQMEATLHTLGCAPVPATFDFCEFGLGLVWNFETPLPIDEGEEAVVRLQSDGSNSSTAWVEPDEQAVE